MPGTSPYATSFTYSVFIHYTPAAAHVHNDLCIRYQALFFAFYVVLYVAKIRACGLGYLIYFCGKQGFPEWVCKEFVYTLLAIINM